MTGSWVGAPPCHHHVSGTGVSGVPVGGAAGKNVVGVLQASPDTSAKLINNNFILVRQVTLMAIFTGFWVGALL